MSSRGRGYMGRSNYRGNNFRGGYRGSNRGSYESRGGGRGGYSYNSEPRYTSSASRYSSRDRIEDSYKKPYRSELSSYTSRDYGRSGSPERKRMRLEGTSSDRRSHDGGHYGGSYSSRQESYSSERRPYEERRRSGSREGYRKSSMGPPREPPRSMVRSTVRTRAPRRSFRGRTMRMRSSFRGALRSRGTYRRYIEKPYSRPYRSVKARSPAKSKDDASSTEDDWDADEKDEATEVKKEVKTKSPKVGEAGGSDAEVGSEAGGGGEETDKEADAASDAPPPRRRPKLSLICVQCKERSLTVAGYARHLLSLKHRAAMNGVARRHKAQLLRMRVAQRSAQRDLEAASTADLAAHTTFCLICRLNHRTTRSAHNLTDTHRAMKRFLMPFCSVCRISFRSPMIYEHHICSIEHLKRKSYQVARRTSPKAERSGDEVMDVDLDNFMTLDSVGDVDEVEDEDSGTEKKDGKETKKDKLEINIGSEHIKKLEVWWCELCRVYLPRHPGGSAEEAECLRRHCRVRAHLGRYVQHRDTRTLRKHAERIHRQLHQQKEDEKSATANTEETSEKAKAEKEDHADDAKKQENGTDSSSIAGHDDKLWADVDKDIGDLLREVEPQGNEGSDDEDDLGRYDRFRKSDKKSKDGDAEENDITLDDTSRDKSLEINTAA